MTKTLGGFKLTVQEGTFTDSEIIVMLGENGTGKTTFVRLLAGEEPDEPADKQSMAVSLKPQTISPKFPGTVRMLLLKQIKAAFMHPQFQSDVVKPMNIENIIDQEVKTLSGGELQRVAIVLALGKPNVSVYLIDEPSSCVFFLECIWQVCARTERISASWTRSSALLQQRSSSVSSYTRRRRLLLSSTTSSWRLTSLTASLSSRVPQLSLPPPRRMLFLSSLFDLWERFDWVRVTADHNRYSRG